MSESQRQTEFLKECLLCEASSESRKLAERITRIQQDERRVQHALTVAGRLAVVAAIGLGYSAIFLNYYPENLLRFTSHLIAQIFCVMGIVSIICLLVFVYVASVRREELNQCRQDCRETVAKFMNLRLGKPVSLPPEDSVARETPPEVETSPVREKQRRTNTQQTQLS